MRERHAAPASHSRPAEDKGLISACVLGRRTDVANALPRNPTQQSESKDPFRRFARRGTFANSTRDPVDRELQITARSVRTTLPAAEFFPT